MARKFAQIQVGIWSDEDFKALPGEQQHMFFVAMSQPRLNLCGVFDYIPSRLARCVSDWTTDDVERLTKELVDARYFVLDYDTHELLIRTFIRNDGLLRVPTVTKGMASDYAEVMSQRLRDAVEVELKRAFKEDSTLAGWKGLKDANPVLFRNVTEGVKS